jgi:translation initiation factor 2 beta subunit (eIF-2beta)/eIF-5
LKWFKTNCRAEILSILQSRQITDGKMSTKTDILIQGMVNSTIPDKSYAVCPKCKSVNIKILDNQGELIDLLCLGCNYNFIKTKLDK